MEERHHVVVLKPFSALQEIQFHHERKSGNLAAECLCELGGSGGRASGRKQVVDDQHALAGLNRVLVDLQTCRAVFQVIMLLHGLGGKLAGLADGNESGLEAIGEGGPEDEATRLHSEHKVDRL